MAQKGRRGPRNGPEGAQDPLAMAAERRDRSTLDMVRHALDARHALLAFQPVMQARRPDMPAFHEGLIRLLDETGRVIPARDFMEVVDNQELGRRIDAMTLDLGLQELAAEPGLRLSVNMSARSIGYRPWMDTLEQGLAANPACAERLILEISESSAMLMPDLVAIFMSEIQARGIAFALDDFGAGATSFACLRDCYFDMAKISGRFVRGIARNPGNQVVVQALASVAQHFDMFTVCESVESAEDAAFLIAAGIDCLQGYHFGAPTLRPAWRSGPGRSAAG
ncbi:EAL domain-containing protein [Poseidonocella sp. HB161398]|uniref:EAL domain-containing protein n=1 Tax=Poseidonocella sp. HB161398 TaxID=2320855 RepID=UPI001108EC02|nr:EAL domain-containing protein [Poseidonocella sp. HB161398]